jgi:integrase
MAQAASSRPSPPRRSHYLGAWTVTDKTSDRYNKCIDKFLHYIDFNNDNATTDEEFDDLLLDFIHELYESGASRSQAANTLYGINLLLPQLKGKLVRSQQAIRGWNKRAVSISYPPLTWELATVISIQLTRQGNYRAGVGVLLAFDCLLRVSELVGLRREDVADSADRRVSTEMQGMLLRLRQTKTGPNKTVRVLDPAVQLLLRGLVSKTRKGQLLFPFSTDRFRRLLKNTCADLGLSDRYVPHSLRHGGATRYYHVLNMSMEDVLYRGRWASTKSARRYIQSGVAMAMAEEAPTRILDTGLEMVKDICLYLSLAQKH